MRRLVAIVAAVLALIPAHAARAEPPVPRTPADYAVLAEQSKLDRAADAGYGALAVNSLMPSGRTTYRRLGDYTTEMDALATANPDLVRPITLPHRTWQNREVRGLEIAADPGARDGRPVFVLLGLHHANEWPSGEHAMEWAYDLIAGYRSDDARTRQLLGSARTIVVPVVNPDGFEFSREAATGSAAEQHRKNCSGGTCAVNGGVDVNRNYGDLWGGTGSSTSPTSGTYRGPAPFSEPETRNIRELIAGRQVTVMITNHTSGRLILRQPGRPEPPTPDDTPYRSLGASFAAENGYANQFSYQLYEHTGTTDGWHYYSTGGFGYVFEIGRAGHGPYADIVAEYDGSSSGGGGNREAYYKALAATANPSLHAVLTGDAPPGAVLRVTKSFSTQTINAGQIPDRLESTMEVPAGGRFEWHLNQSGRPRAAAEQWTLSCESPEGSVLHSQAVQIGRGQAREVTPCSAPRPEPDGGNPGSGEATGGAADNRGQARVHSRLAANFDGRLYRISIKGSLRKGTVDADEGRAGAGSQCAGRVRVTLMHAGRRFATGKASLDGACGFERKFRVKSRRSRRSLRAVTNWSGNEFLSGGQGAVSVRVRKRSR